MDFPPATPSQPSSLGRIVPFLASTGKYYRGDKTTRTSYGFKLRKRIKRRGIGGRKKKPESEDQEHISNKIPDSPLANIPIDASSIPDNDDLSMSFVEEPEIRTPGSSQEHIPLESLSFSTPRTVHSFYTVDPICTTCNGRGRITRKTLTSALREKSDSIACFEDESGKEIYKHVRFPDKQKALSDTISEKTVKRRSDTLLSIATLLVNEINTDNNEESIAKILVTLLNSRKTLKKLVIKKMNIETIPTISAEKALPMLVKLSHSKKNAEDIMTEITGLIGKKIFDPRNKYRTLYNTKDLNAIYGRKIISMEKGDFLEKIPVAFMCNIAEVLLKYVTIMRDKIEVSGRTNNAYRLRIGVDKGGTDTKISLSFADSVFCQSPHGQLVVASYEGVDSNPYLIASVSEVFDTIAKIKELPRDDLMVPVHLYLVGDNKSISAVIGHGGQASMSPCPICPLDHWWLKMDGGLSSQNTKPRSDYESDHRMASITATPLILMDSHYIVPPCLHNFLSPAYTLLSLIYADAGYMDQCIVKNEEILDQMLPSSQDSKLKKKNTKELSKEGILNSQKTVNRVIDAIKKQRLNDQLSQNGCGLAWCYKKIGVKVAAKYGEAMGDCSICKNMIHLFCNGEVVPEKKKRKDNLTCQRCIDKDVNPILMFEEAIQSLIAQYDIEALLKDSRTRKGNVHEIDEILKDLKIVPQQYQGGILTGNDCRKFLEQCQKITSIFVNHQAKNIREKETLTRLAEKYNKIANLLYNIQSYTSNSYLNKDDVIELEKLCKALPSLCKKIAALNITPKLHELAVHFPNFAREHGTLGKFSEQYVEHAHVEWNRLSAHYSTTRSGSQRLQAVMKNTNIRNTISCLYK